ncbi:MAG: flagellar export chaperone FlgN [Leptospiraceae bacterium]|nr:flagellar export chaperone FlgN [Leptospiraceae bacterium]
MKLEQLEAAFKEEISIYKSLLILETSKKEAILRSNGKHLENYTKQTSMMMNTLTNVEAKRTKLLNEYFASEKDAAAVVPTVTEFLNRLDKVTLAKFKPLTNDLKFVVMDLKEKITVNEELLKSKLEIFTLSIDALKTASEAPVSELYGDNSKSKSRTNVMLNMRA